MHKAFFNPDAFIKAWQPEPKLPAGGGAAPAAGAPAPPAAAAASAPAAAVPAPAAAVPAPAAAVPAPVPKEYPAAVFTKRAKGQDRQHTSCVCVRVFTQPFSVQQHPPAAIARNPIPTSPKDCKRSHSYATHRHSAHFRRCSEPFTQSHYIFTTIPHSVYVI